MHFSSFYEFLQMGGYAFYVWLAYAITFGGMLWIVLSAYFMRGKLCREIQNKAAREQRMKQAQQRENTL